MPKSVQSVQEPSGNTRSAPSSVKVSASVSWCFTFNNYTDDDFEVCKTFFQNYPNCLKAVIGKEIGEIEKTPHLQGVVVLEKRARWSEFKLSKKINWSKTKNAAASIEYCKKDGNYWSKGLPKPLKIIENLKPWQLQIEQLLKTEPDGRSVYWYWESIGNVGKSSLCKYLYVKHKRILVIQGGKLSDIVNLIYNYLEKADNEIDMILIDVPRKNKNKVSYAAIECISNGMITNTKFETGIAVFNPPHVVVFSNYPPEMNEDDISLDRWKVTEITRELNGLPPLEEVTNDLDV